MSELPVIERIRQAAFECPEGPIDAPVYYDNDISLYVFVDLSKSDSYYVDVPLDKVIALTRNDFLKDPQTSQVIAKTWREAVSCLHGGGWSPAVISYFEKPLLEEHFPAPNALGELRLQAVGGAIKVTNGTHRTVAAKAWLLKGRGNQASLHRVKLKRYRVPETIKSLLKGALDAGRALEVYTLRGEERSRRALANKSLNSLIRFPSEYRMRAITLADEITAVPTWKPWYH